MTLETIGIVALAVIVAGGAMVSIKFSKQRNKTNTNKVNIRNVDTTGDVAGRDIKKK